MILQEAAGLSLSEYMEEAISVKTRGVVVHSKTGAPALAVLARGDILRLFSIINLFLRKTICHQTKNPGGRFMPFSFAFTMASSTPRQWRIVATIRLPENE